MGKKSKRSRASGYHAAPKRDLLSWPNIAMGGLVAIVVVAIAVTLIQTPKREALTGVQLYNNLERTHTTEAVSYQQTPPVGGPHFPTWQNCGLYTEPVPSETAVHSLEHGAVWITYRPDLPESEVRLLRDLAHKQSFILVSPYPDLPSPVVASAWGAQLQLEAATDKRLDSFIQTYRLGKSTPEPGAPCTGGYGQPS